MSEPKVLGEVIGDVMEKMDAPPSLVAALRAAGQQHCGAPPSTMRTTVVGLDKKDGMPNMITRPLERPFRMERVVVSLDVARADLTPEEQLEQITIGKRELLANPIPLKVVVNPTTAIRMLLTEEEDALYAAGLPIPHWNELAAKVDAEVGVMLDMMIDGDWSEKGDSIEFRFSEKAAARIVNMAMFGAVVVEDSGG
jgi:hypothetical protein